jgi:hypothetical protein
MFAAQFDVLEVNKATVETDVDQFWRVPRDQLLVWPAAVLTLETGVDQSWKAPRDQLLFAPTDVLIDEIVVE